MLALLALSLACDETNNLAIGDGDSGTETPTGSDTGPTRGTPQSEDPIIESGTIYCTTGSNSSGDIFYVELVATDPEGPDTLASFGSTVTAYDSAGVEHFSDTILVCDDRGQCSGSFRDGTFGSVTCSSYDLWTYKAQVVDEDDNWSTPYLLVWTSG